MARLLIFGPGYTATRIARAATGRGWFVDSVTRANFLDADTKIDWATHILSSVPPSEAGDPVLARYGGTIARTGARLIYLSSTGVYGDTGGAWVDETAPTGSGRRTVRAQADRAWLGIEARVLRLPGIYGPGRSPLDRLAAGAAYRVDVADQVFSRIHVDDIVTAAHTAWDAPPGAYNIADDLPAPQNEVTDYAARLLGRPSPPLLAIDQLSTAARAFYAENRRVANGKAKRVLGWTPRYPTYCEGLRALSASTSPASASPPPSAAVRDQT